MRTEERSWDMRKKGRNAAQSHGPTGTERWVAGNETVAIPTKEKHKVRYITHYQRKYHISKCEDFLNYNQRNVYMKAGGDGGRTGKGSDLCCTRTTHSGGARMSQEAENVAARRRTKITKPERLCRTWKTYEVYSKSTTGSP